MKNIEQKLKAILIDKVGSEETDITPDANLSNDLGCDSLDIVETCMECELEFQINISFEEFEKLETVGKIVEYIESKTV
jgi:acyl carrier protein